MKTQDELRAPNEDCLTPRAKELLDKLRAGWEGRQPLRKPLASTVLYYGGGSGLDRGYTIKTVRLLTDRGLAEWHAYETVRLLRATTNPVPSAQPV